MSGIQRIYRRNPLAFPGGRNPGFDPSHIAAAGIAPGHGLSAIASGANMLNLLTAAKGTINGTVTAKVVGNLGQTAGLNNAGSQLTFPAQSTATDISGTIAIIFQTPNAFTTNQWFATNIINGGFHLTPNGAGATTQAEFVFGGTGVTTLQSTFPNPIAQNIPYFLAASASSTQAAGASATVVNFLLLNLLTGQVQTSTATAAKLTPAAASGTITICQSAALMGQVAAAMFAPSFMSLPALLQWAQSPWDFWYPPTVENAIFGALGGGITSATVALLAASGAMSFGRASPSGLVDLSGRGAASAKAFASLKGTVLLATRGRASASGRAVPLGNVAMLARGAAAAFGRAGIGAGQVVALFANAFARASGALKPTLKAALSARANAAATGRAAPAARLGLLAQGFAAAFGWLAYTAFVFLPNPKFGTRPRPRRFGTATLTRRFGTLASRRMPKSRDFSIMDVGETVNGWIDFNQWLAAGETLASVTSVTPANYLPDTGNAFVTTTGAARIGTVPTTQGGSGVANAAVLQQWTGAAPGIARITAIVVTSAGQTLTAWAHQEVQTPD